MTDTISTQRNAIRQQIRASRKTISTAEQDRASLQLLTTLKAHPKVLQAQRVSVTLSYDGEIDVAPFIDWCWQQNIQVFLPVVHPTNIGKLLFLAYRYDTEMVKNRYGITEPKLMKDTNNPRGYLDACSVSDLDIVFTPLVAFDQQGNRIGMGGGYYDRLLEPWFTRKSGPYPIGLAHHCQYIQNIPIQRWDVPLPEIITPVKHFHF